MFELCLKYLAMFNEQHYKEILKGGALPPPPPPPPPLDPPLSVNIIFERQDV